MHFSTILDFLQTFWIPLIITSIGALLYGSFVKWYGKVGLGQSLALFFTGIIVITCIFLPFNWSIQNSDMGGKELSLFFFELNIEGNNFISDFRGSLESLGIPENWTQNSIILFLAFLEELAKLTLLILCIRKSLRMPVILLYIFIAGTFINRLLDANSQVLVMGVGGLGFIGLIILWFLLWARVKTESVADYMYSIAIVALGFAFAENIKYMIDLNNAGQSHEVIVNNAMLRAIFGYLSHTFFSMVCVSLYARGRFAFLRLLDNTGALSLSQKALGWKWYTQMKSIQGFWFGVIAASLLHGIYNIYISQDILIPSVMLIVGFLILELFVLHDLRNNTRYGHIENYMQ
jgi:hypothetical protein